MRNKFISLDGDHMMLVNINEAYKVAKGNKISNYCNVREPCILKSSSVLV